MTEPSEESDRPDRLVRRHAADWRRRALIVSVMAAYPVAFMRGVLRPDSPYHLRNKYADPLLLTDFDGGVRLTQIIDAMRWPWSASPLSAWPTGESIGRWQTLSQGIQFGFLYLVTRVAPPVFAINLLVFVGWLVTGLAVYGLARRLGATRITAMAAGVLAQMLPSIPTMAANYTSYVFIGVPVYVVCRSLDMARLPSRRNFAWLLMSLAITLFFDPYWFFFSLFVVLVVALCNRGALLEWYRGSPRLIRLAVFGFVAAPVVLVGGVFVLDRMVAGDSSSRPLGIAHPGLIDAGLRSPWHWLRSSWEGVGVVVAVLGIAGAAWVVRERTDRTRVTAVVVAASLVLLSTRTRVETPWFDIGSFAEYARFGLPGVRFFQRAALIAEAMWCVGAALFVQGALRRAAGTGPAALRLAGVALVIVALLVELAPLSHRAIQRRWDDFGAFRAVLAETPEPIVAAVPFDRAGRSWFELGLLGSVRSINPLFSSERASLTAAAASRGPESLAAYLDSLGVTHLLAVLGDDGYPITYDLQEPRFVLRGQLLLNNYEFDPQIVGLYEVHKQPGDTVCDDCPVGGGYELIADVEAEGDVGILEETPIVSWWWTDGRRTELTPTLVDIGFPYETEIELTFGNAPCATPQTIDVSWGEFEQRIELRGSENPTVRLPVTWAEELEPIEITVDGELCRIPGDRRRLGVQIFWPKIVAPDT